MAKAAPDAMIDASLDYVAGSTAMYLCSAQPTTYAEATSTFALADVVMAGGDFTKADAGGGGRQVTVAAKSGVTVDTTGTANHVALVETAGSTLRYVTTMTAQALTSGNTANIGSWVISIGDPT